MGARLTGGRQITRELYKLYRSNKYKNSGFKCVDNWSFVKSEDEKNILDKELLEYLNNQKLEKIYFSPPEMLDIMKSQFQYGNSKKFYNELNINDYLLYKKNVIKSVSVLKNDYVYLYNKDLNDENTTKFRIYNCIVAELTHDNKDTYILFEGKWRKIDKDFMSSVSSYLFKNNIEFDSDCLKIELKNTLKDSNNEYIESAFNENCVRNSQNLLLMDKSKNIIAGKRIYELCDILSSRGELIHVKKYSGGSSSLSHLFVQVCFYSDAIISDDSARTSMFEFIKKTILDHDSVNYGKEESSFIDIINKSNSSNSNKLTVVLCILSTSSIKLKELPFMVLYEIKQIDSYLKSHFNFKVKYINRVFGEKKK